MIGLVKNFFKLNVLGSLAKGFSVFYFVLLPIFYSERIINSAQLGYIGAIFILMVILGAFIVARWLHNVETKVLLSTVAWFAGISTLILLMASNYKNLTWITISYALMGLSSGIAISCINALIANSTYQGKRFRPIAQLSMVTDIIRIIFPILVSGLLIIGTIQMAIWLIILANIIFIIFTYLLKPEGSDTHISELHTKDLTKLQHNKGFRFILILEFLDSFASSQLFVFIPLLFLAKGYSIQGTLLLQTFIFLGYLTGRWSMGFIASKYSGYKAIAFAELGMITSIVLLLNVKWVGLLYILSFALGLFTRGTSPVLKALSFDNLLNHQIKQGSAIHVMVGDGGSALAQFIFGLLVAWYGVNSPFIVAAVIGFLIMVFAARKSLLK